MNKNDEILIEKAISYQNKNWHKRALKILHSVEIRHKNVSCLYGLIASSYYQLKQFELSLKYFKKTTKLNPDSELASLGLFHSLMKLNKTNLAFNEIIRFTKKNTPKHYLITLKGLKDNVCNFNKFEKKKISSLIYIEQKI